MRCRLGLSNPTPGHRLESPRFSIASILVVIASSPCESTVQDEALSSTLELFQRSTRVRSGDRRERILVWQGMPAIVISKKIQETEPAFHELQEMGIATRVLPPDHYQMGSQSQRQDLGRGGEFETTIP